MFVVCIMAAFLQQDVPQTEKSEHQEQVAAYLAEEKYSALYKTSDAWSQLLGKTRLVIAKQLVLELRQIKRVPLRETDDIGIPHRMRTGEIKFPGLGGIINQDLFLTGGRAAFALEMMLERELPTLHGGLKVDEWAKRAAKIEETVQRWRNIVSRP